MASAARVHIIERNRDPRSLTTIAFGGAGPAHAVAVARILGSPTVIFPPGAGVASAFGALVAPVAFTAGRTRMTRLDRANWDEINAMYATWKRRRAASCCRPASIPRITTSLGRDALWKGSTTRSASRSDGIELAESSLPTIERRLRCRLRAQYGRVLEGLPIEALHWRLSRIWSGVAGHAQPAPLGEPATPAGGDQGLPPSLLPAGWPATRFHRHARLRPRTTRAGHDLHGPAIIEEREATAVIWPGDRPASMPGAR